MKLAEMHCNVEHAHTPLPPEQLGALLQALPGWEIIQQRVTKTFEFVDFFETMAFVNALAWIAHQEDHHPDLSVHYNRVRVEWSTHDAGQLTLNDLICAAKCETLRTED